MKVHSEVASDAAGTVPTQREAVDVATSSAQLDALEHYGWETPDKPSTKLRSRIRRYSMVRSGESTRTTERDG
jgi:hypothetical protein